MERVLSRATAEFEFGEGDLVWSRADTLREPEKRRAGTVFELVCRIRDGTSRASYLVRWEADYGGEKHSQELTGAELVPALRPMVPADDPPPAEDAAAPENRHWMLGRRCHVRDRREGKEPWDTRPGVASLVSQDTAAGGVVYVVALDDGEVVTEHETDILNIADDTRGE